MAKLGRIIEITRELKQLSGGDAADYADADADESTVAKSASAAAAVDLPSDSDRIPP